LSTPYPYTPDGSPPFTPGTPWPDPWVLIGAMAAVTTRLRFMTNVYVAPARNPFLVAKQVGTAAVLSGDRVALGVGAGWMREEFEQLGQPFGDRGRRLDEMIEVVRALWRGGMVEHHGEHYDFHRLQMSPVPAAPVPIYCGGQSRRAIERASRLDRRANRVAHHLLDRGVGPGDHVGIYAWNRAEWVETMLGAYKARAVPINVNYRYVEDELRYIFDNADLAALVFERSFAPKVAAVLPDLPRLRHLVVVDDESGSHTDSRATTTPGAVPYEDALAGASPER